MPGRTDKFTVGGIYHIFNKYIDGKHLFTIADNANLFLDTLFYYRSTNAKLSFSEFKVRPKKEQKDIWHQLSFRKFFRVDILGYCLMPTHFHLLLKQLVDDGVKVFMSNCLNSFTRNLNIKIKRKGPLFLPRFQSGQVITDEQLIHVSRYKHLNPYSAGLIKDIADLEKYPWSSYRYFVSNSISPLVNTEPVLALFDGNRDRYRSFVINQAEYQKSLESLKYMEKWLF